MKQLPNANFVPTAASDRRQGPAAAW